MLTKGLGVPLMLSRTRMETAVSGLKQSIETARSELTTGLSADPVEHLRGNTTTMLRLNAELGDIEVYQRSISLSQVRVQASETALDIAVRDLETLATGALAASRRGDDASLRSIGRQAQTLLETSISALNTRVSGHAVFAGSDTTTTPFVESAVIVQQVTVLIGGAADEAGALDAIAAFFDDTAATNFSSEVYRGNGDRLAGETGPGARITFGVPGNSEALRDLIQGLATLAQMDDENPAVAMRARSSVVVEQSSALVLTAQAGIRAMQTDLGVAGAGFEAAASQREEQSTRINDSLVDLVGRDPYAAATRLTELEGQLDAAYILTNRLNQLSLANYLR